MSKLSSELIKALESLQYTYVKVDTMGAGSILKNLCIDNTAINRNELTAILTEVNGSPDLIHPYLAEQEPDKLDVDTFVYQYLKFDKKEFHYQAFGESIREDGVWVGMINPKVEFKYWST